MSVKQFIKHHYRHFNAAVVIDAAEAYVQHLEKGGKMFVTLAGAMSTAELGLSLADMIRADKVAAICCTGANLEEDVFNLVAHDYYKRVPHYRQLSPQEEVELRDKGMARGGRSREMLDEGLKECLTDCARRPFGNGAQRRGLFARVPRIRLAPHGAQDAIPAMIELPARVNTVSDGAYQCLANGARAAMRRSTPIGPMPKTASISNMKPHRTCCASAASKPSANST